MPWPSQNDAKLALGRLSKGIRRYFLISNISLLFRAICSHILLCFGGQLFFHVLIWAFLHITFSALD